MSKTTSTSADLKALKLRIRAILPMAYHSCSEDVSPTSMGSAGLKYDKAGKVAWDQIWTSFCDLALAGGPPHRGKLLQPTAPVTAQADIEKCKEVACEIQRGILLSTELTSEAGPLPGWVTVPCNSSEMATWLHRAILAENVFVSRKDNAVVLPAGPNFSLPKEIKNVIVAIAKTCHYWLGHISPDEQLKAGKIMNDSELIIPPLEVDSTFQTTEYKVVANQSEVAMGEALGLKPYPCEDFGWVAFVCQDELMAAWFVRSAIAENILSRRENNILFLPVISSQEKRVIQILIRLTQIWNYLKEKEDA